MVRGIERAEHRLLRRPEERSEEDIAVEQDQTRKSGGGHLRIHQRAPQVVVGVDQRQRYRIELEGLPIVLQYGFDQLFEADDADQSQLDLLKSRQHLFVVARALHELDQLALERLILENDVAFQFEKILDWLPDLNARDCDGG